MRKGENNLFMIGIIGVIALLFVATNPDILANLGFSSTIGTTSNWGVPVYACVMYEENECQTVDQNLYGTVLLGSYGETPDILPKGSYANCEVIGHEDWPAMTWEVGSDVTVRRKKGGSWTIIRLADQPEFQGMICQVTIPEDETLGNSKLRFFNTGTEPDEPVDVPDEPDLPPVEEEEIVEPAIEDVIIDGLPYEEVITGEDPDMVTTVTVDGVEVDTEVIVDSSGNKHLVITTGVGGFSDTEMWSIALIIIAILVVVMIFVGRR